MSASNTDTNDLYKEYVYINKGTSENPNWDWEILGTIRFDISNYPTNSETVLDAGGSITNTIYSLEAKRVFSGHNLTDAPVQGWVSGLVLGSNWNNNHY
jgi:hypothetical protein